MSDAGMYVDVPVVGVVEERASLPVSSDLSLVTFVESSRDGGRPPATRADTIILRPHVQATARPWIAGIAFPHCYLFSEPAGQDIGLIGDWSGARAGTNDEQSSKNG